MKATLKTRCGCTRELDIPYPPNRYIVLPLLTPLNLDAKEWATAPLVVRRFNIQQFENRGPYVSTAEYLEVDG